MPLSLSWSEELPVFIQAALAGVSDFSANEYTIQVAPFCVEREVSDIAHESWSQPCRIFSSTACGGGEDAKSIPTPAAGT